MPSLTTRSWSISAFEAAGDQAEHLALAWLGDAGPAWFHDEAGILLTGLVWLAASLPAWLATEVPATSHRAS